MTILPSRRHMTAKLIQTEAVRLAVRDGLGNITTEEIAHAAGVSARTFFNYYPYKEAALLGPNLDYPPGVVEAFIKGTDTLIADLGRMTCAHLGRLECDRNLLKDVILLSEDDPKLRALRNNMVLSRHSQMTLMLRSRLPDESQPVLNILAAAIISAINTALQDWALSSEGDLASAIRKYLGLIAPATGLLNQS